MTALTNATLADRIAALDWSGVSLQHQLAVVAACETLRNSSVAEVEQAALSMESAERSFSDWITTSKPTSAVENVLLFPALRVPSPDLLRGAACTERRVTLRRMDGSTATSTICSRSERWDWIVSTACELSKCSPEDVAMVDDTVTVDGLPVFSC